MARRPHRPPALINRAVLAVLRSTRLHRLLDAELCELRYRTADGTRTVALPVLYAADGDRYVVLVGDAPDKKWWRHFRREAPVELRRGGLVRNGSGRILPHDDPAYAAAVRTHQDRHHVPVVGTDEVLLIEAGAG
ncbi:hypothetical protein EV385_1146 [Krasilnikovia cinnamomea]|uniref:Deazaflavin-dependent oxidoreductase (Nitroreductase family) n=1 Tax=Krasilnikovia cinnamomea TaxID=349313 RepID=A0A4V2G6N3_9ACTN|nr:hypothetical protein [Krasilnikovia cinnamomea]RZU49396.1 hypothetical protein EV385_1146 [Krasilnikovia cinnamomea]